MLKYLLATNIVIYVIKRQPIEVLGVFNENAGRPKFSYAPEGAGQGPA